MAIQLQRGITRTSLFFHLMSHGVTGAGKTNFSCTAPKPIGLVPIDQNTQITYAKVWAERNFNPNDLVLPADSVDLTRSANAPRHLLFKKDLGTLTEKESVELQKYYIESLIKIKELILLYASMPDIRTIVIDSGTQLWADILFAEFGRTTKIMPRDRGAAKQAMKELVSSVGKKNLIVTHYSKPVWKDDKQTDKLTHDGFNEIGYITNVAVEHFRPDTLGEGMYLGNQLAFKSPIRANEFVAVIRKSHFNPWLLDYPEQKVMLGNDCNFAGYF